MLKGYSHAGAWIRLTRYIGIYDAAKGLYNEIQCRLPSQMSLSRQRRDG